MGTVFSPATNQLVSVLDRAWRLGISLQSQYFRENPKLVALAASLGLITTLDPEGNYGGIWRVTPEGCTELFNQFKHEESINDFNKSQELPPVYPLGTGRSSNTNSSNNEELFNPISCT